MFPSLQRLGKVVEDRKSFAIATSEENKPKNRYDFVLPYDSNRVILAPLSTRPSSTYINASFVTVSTIFFIPEKCVVGFTQFYLKLLVLLTCIHIQINIIY